jgi:hypothetical protein
MWAEIRPYFVHDFSIGRNNSNLMHPTIKATNVNVIAPAQAVLSPPLSSLAPGAFLRRLVEGNHLVGISRFLFPPGSLFCAPDLWWSSGPHTSPARRPHPHEGLDLYWMEKETGDVQAIDPFMQIPSLLPGTLLHSHPDFLGETLYIQHPDIRQGNACFHTIFGHTRPGGWTGTTEILPDQFLGTINPLAAEGKAPAHLHISCAWIANDFPCTALCWEALATNEAVQLIDPLPLLIAGQELPDLLAAK